MDATITSVSTGEEAYYSISYAITGTFPEKPPIATRNEKRCASYTTTSDPGTEVTLILVGFSGPTIVKIVKDLKDHILACHGSENPDSLESFLGRVVEGTDPALRVALTLAMFAGGQAVAEASIRLRRESESRSRERLESVGQARSTAPTRTFLDAEDRLQTFLGGYGYIEAYMLGRGVPSRGGVIEQSPVHIPIIDDEPADEAVGAPPQPTAALTSAPATTTESLAEIPVTAAATTTSAVPSLVAIRGSSRGGLRRFICKSTGIAVTFKKSLGQGLARSQGDGYQAERWDHFNSCETGR